MKHDTQSGNITAGLICIAGLLLFNWPLLSIAAERSELQPLIYLYTTWLAFVAGLWWYCRRAAAALREDIAREQKS